MKLTENLWGALLSLSLSFSLGCSENEPIERHAGRGPRKSDRRSAPSATRESSSAGDSEEDRAEAQPNSGEAPDLEREKGSDSELAPPSDGKPHSIVKVRLGIVSRWSDARRPEATSMENEASDALERQTPRARPRFASHRSKGQGSKGQEGVVKPARAKPQEAEDEDSSVVESKVEGSGSDSDQSAKD